MKKFFLIPAIAVFATLFSACSNDEPTPPPANDPETEGLFIINQGNWMAGNSSLSYYTPDDDTVEQEVFFRANDARLGDMAQSMTIDSKNNGWIVVNNSNVIFAIDVDTYKEKGRITDGIVSPRYIHFVSPTKAYVSQLYTNTIAVVDPTTYAVTGYITVPGMEASTGSTEMMVQAGKYVYVNCWSYNSTIIKIDTTSDTVVASLEVGIQPKAITLDADNNLWVISDGGYYGAPAYGNPTLVKVNTATFSIDLSMEMPIDSNIVSVVTNGDGTQLYWICDDVYTMPIGSTSLPAEPIIKSNQRFFNGLTVNPKNGDIYVADAVDYVQLGVVHRYNADGEFVSDIPAGLLPGGFCWKLGHE